MSPLLFILSSLYAVICNPPGTGSFLYNHKVTAAAGDNAPLLLKRYYLDESTTNLDRFYTLNAVSKNEPLRAGQKYIMPILIYRYDGKSIRTTIADSDYTRAVRIQKYNEKIRSAGLRQTRYQESKLLWVPYQEVQKKSVPTGLKKSKELLGAEYDFKMRGHSLENKVYYLVAGHGGPDPGAINTFRKNNSARMNIPMMSFCDYTKRLSSTEESPK